MPAACLAILCAMVWSLSIILMKQAGTKIHPLALNLGKNLLGLVLLLLSTLIVEGHLQWPARWQDTGLLLLSGLMGIGIADGLVLRAMQHLQASHIAILECLFAPFIILLSIVLLGEWPRSEVLVGGALILASLLFVISPQPSAPTAPGARTGLGVVLMASGLFMVALGIIMIKPLFQQIPLFSLVSIRMLAGVAGSALIFAMTRDRRLRLREFIGTPDKMRLFLGCFLSAYVSILLWIAGYKNLPAPVAALLNQTSTVFTVLFAMILLKEKLNWRKSVAIALAMSGALLISVVP